MTDCSLFSEPFATLRVLVTRLRTLRSCTSIACFSVPEAIGRMPDPDSQPDGAADPPPPPANSRRRERIAGLRNTLRSYAQLPVPVLILCLGSFINRAGSFAMLFLTIYISEHLGFGVTFAANCFGVFGLGSMIASMTGGQLADHFGRKPIMLLALFGGALMLTLFTMASSRTGILAVMLGFSLTMEMYRPAAAAMVGDLVDAVQRPMAFGLMYIAFNLGFTVAAPLGGFLAERSFEWLFWGDALTTAAYGLMIVFLISETLPAESPATVSGQSSRVSWPEALRHILRDTPFVVFSIATLLTSIVFMQGFSTLPIYLTGTGHSKEEVGLLLSVNGILIVVLQIPLTVTLSRFRRLSVILAGEVLIAIGYGLTTFATAWPMFLTTIIIWTIGEVVQAAFKQSMVADLAPNNMRGRYMGVFSLCHAIGLTGGVPLGGRILEQWGPHVLWPCCFLCAMTAAGLYCLLPFVGRSTTLSS